MAEERSRGAEYIICEGIEKSFSARTAGEQKEILQHKKPQPKLGHRIVNRQKGHSALFRGHGFFRACVSMGFIETRPVV